MAGELPGEAYAVTDEDAGTVTFIRSEVGVEGGRAYDCRVEALEQPRPVRAAIVDVDGDRHEGVVYTGFESAVSFSGPWALRPRVREVVFKNMVRPRSTTAWFNYCDRLVRVRGAENLDMSACEGAALMFSGCFLLESVDVSRWDVGRLEEASGMFGSCESLAGLDVSRWDTRSLRDASSMFRGCSSLVDLDVSRWDTRGLESASGMFADCSSLSSMDVSAWDTASLAATDCMFDGCGRLGRVDVSRWDTSRLKDASWMFRDCTALSDLTLPGAGLPDGVKTFGMLDGCPGAGRVGGRGQFAPEIHER